MKFPLFAIRPDAGLSETLVAARAAGLTIHGEPLFEVEPVAWKAPKSDAFDGLLIGSANALRHAGAALKTLADKPVYAVGARTSDVARAVGLRVAATGEGGLQALLDGVPPPLRLLRLAGEEHVALAPSPGVSITTRVVYRAKPLPMSAGFAARLRQGGIVMLHSGAAAAHFAAECDRVVIARSSLKLAALAPRILERAGSGWAAAEAAARPDEGALLALVRDLCQGGAQGSKNGR